jgi:hypothetical protein
MEEERERTRQGEREREREREMRDHTVFSATGLLTLMCWDLFAKSTVRNQ